MSAIAEPKKRSAPKTRAKILSAAQQAFSELGYSQTGIREIGAIAGVSSTLLLRYFGSKAGLYEAALTEAVENIGVIFDVRRDQFGEHLTNLLLDASLDIKPTAMVALATGDPDAREITARVTDKHVVTPLAEWLGAPDARARALEMVMLCNGFVMYSRQLPLMRTSRGNEKKLATWLARTIQAIVDQA